MSETEVLPEQETRIHEDVRPDTSHGDGDHERFAHYVDKNKIVDSTVTGTPVTALCGKVWVPSRDPKRYPVCPDLQGDLRAAPPRRGRQATERRAPSPSEPRRLAPGNISAS